MSAATLYPSGKPQALRASNDEAPTAAVGRIVERMTMEQWKAIHRDFKGSHIGPDGKRWRAVLRCGGLVAVEIVKP